MNASALPQVSVIIPARNAAKVLPRQLDALAAQSFAGDWEVLVADNRSEDETAAVVRARADGFPTVLHLVDAGERVGSCHARNAAAVRSRGAVLLFCDADDVVDVDWVREGVAALEHADLAAGATRELRDPIDPQAPLVHPDLWVGRAGSEVVISSNLAVRRAFYFRAGGFDESLPPYGCHDIEFGLRVRKAGGRVVRASGMTVYFRRTTDPRALLRKVYRSGRTEPLVWDRHPDLFPGRRRSAGEAGRELASYPVEKLADLAHGRPLRPRQDAREFVVRLGHVAAYLPGGTRSRDTCARLLTPADDPLTRPTEDASQ